MLPHPPRNPIPYPACRPLLRTGPDGVQTSYTYDDANRRTLVTDAASGETATTYDPAGNVSTVTDARGTVTSHAYDDLNRRTETIVDSGGGHLNLTTTYTYGLTGGGGGCGCGTSAGFGQLNKITDPAGKVRYNYYDLLNRRTKEVRKNTDSDDDGGDSDDAITETTYDAMGRATLVTQQADPSPDYAVETHYDAAGRVDKRTIDPGGLDLITEYTHDPNGNVLTETLPSGNVVSHTYDRANRRTETTDSIGNVEFRSYDADGNLTKLATADERHTDYEYDALDRLKTITDRVGKETTFTYDKLGHELTRKDRNNHTTTTAYDALYRRTSVTDPLSNVTEFQYDEVGNLTRLRAVNGAQNQDTIYDYDRANRRTQEKYPTANCSPPVDSGDVRVYTYNGAGRLATRTDQNGDVTTYSYDDLHRLTGRSYARGGSSVSYPTTQGVDSFTYDRAGRMTSADHVQGADTFTLDFGYDAAGRLTSEDQDGFSLAYAYAVGPTNHYVQTTYSNGRTVKHNFDARGRVSVITTTTQSVTTTQATNEYDDDNRLLSRAFGNGTTATWTYDNEDRVATIKHHCPGCGVGSSAWDFVDLAYVRDDEGNPLSCKHNHATTTSELYAYDAADRLVDFQRGTLAGDGKSVTGTPGEAQRWELDALGNWKDFEKDQSGTKVLDQSRTHRIDNALTAMGGTSLTYDPPGNLKDDGTYLYDYDCENRLTRVRTATTQPVLIAEYGYNALGWRVKKLIDNSDTLDGTFRLIYNQSWQLLEIRTVSGGSTTIAKQFIHAGPGLPPLLAGEGGVRAPYIDDHISMLTPSGGGWIAHYYHRDALFNTLTLSDSSAAVAERAQFEPYGSATLTDSGGGSLANSALGNPFERQGIIRDWESGGDESRQRSYSAALGRWMQRDPLFTSEASVMLAQEFEHSPASFAGAASNAVHDGPQTGPRPCGGGIGPSEPGTVHAWPTYAMQLALRQSAQAETRWASRASQFEASGGNPLRWSDPSGLAFSDPIFTGPEIYQCCMPFVVRAGPYCNPDIDAGWRTIVRADQDCCCGPGRRGKQVCSSEHHYVAGRCTYIVTTTYVKSGSPYCQTATCPGDSVSYDFYITPPHPDGQVRNTQCFPCVCAGDP